MMIDAAALFQSSMLHADSLNIQQLLRRAGIALVSLSIIYAAAEQGWACSLFPLAAAMCSTGSNRTAEVTGTECASGSSFPDQRKPGLATKHVKVVLGEMAASSMNAALQIGPFTYCKAPLPRHRRERKPV